jgi:transcriptional regulator
MLKIRPERAKASDPRERRGDSGVPASERAGGAAGAKPPGSNIDEAKRGSTELLILALVEDSDVHGYEISGQIEARSDGTLRFTLASLYATLYRMEARGWIRGRWIERAGQRRRRYYRITETGRRVLAEQRRDWARFVGALHRVAGVKLT